MNLSDKARIFELRTHLLHRGLTLTDFAAQLGESLPTVSTVIKRHWRTSKEIRGLKSYKIISALEQLLASQN